MTTEFADGFDWLPSSGTATAILTKWSIGVTSASRSAGRYSGDTQPTFAVGAINLKRAFSPSRYVITGAAVFTGASADVFTILGPGDAQYKLRWDVGVGEFVLFRGPIGSYVQLGATSIGGAVNQWYHVELAGYIDNSAGLLVLNVNGAHALTVSGVDTQGDSTHTATRMQLGDSGGVGANGLFTDDLFNRIGTPDTTITADMLGDRFIQTLWPASDSTINADWTPSSGSDLYAMIDDADAGGGPNTADYITADTVGTRYGVFLDSVDTSVIESIEFAQWNQLAKYNEAGPDYLRAMLKISGTDYTGGTQHLLNSTYFTWRDMYETSPDTGVAWTSSEIDATEWGGAKE